jgi:hypothetical protein
MNKAILAILAIVAALALLAFGVYSARPFLSSGKTIRGSGNVVEESRPISDINGVNLATIGHLVIEVGETDTLRVEAEDNLMEHLKTVEQGGKLTIGTRGSVRLNATKPVNYYLTVTDLDTIEITSVGDIEAPDLKAEDFLIRIKSDGNLEMGDLETEALKVEISSSGDVSMGELKADKLDVDITSTGNLDIAGGEVTTQKINLGSAGKYTAPDLASDEADARLSSNGSATIWVKDYLKAILNSSGDLRYRGNPRMEVTTNSSGDVIQISD